MELKLLSKEEVEYTEQLGKDMAVGKIKGTINLIDELEKIKKLDKGWLNRQGQYE